MLKDELNKSPFTVPNDYFDHLPTRVQEKCVVQGSKVKSGIWATTIKPRLSYVAGFGALAMLAYGGFSLIGGGNNPAGSLANDKNNTKKTRPITANSYINNNSKSYAQFLDGNSSNPLIHIVNDDNKSRTADKYDERVLDYLAVENINVEDILGF